MREVVVPCDADSPLVDGPWVVLPMLARGGVHVLFEDPQASS